MGWSEFASHASRALEPTIRSLYQWIKDNKNSSVDESLQYVRKSKTVDASAKEIKDQFNPSLI